MRLRCSIRRQYRRLLPISSPSDRAVRLVCKDLDKLAIQAMSDAQRESTKSICHTLDFKLRFESSDSFLRVSRNKGLRHLVKEIRVPLYPLDLVYLSKQTSSG